MTSVDISIDQEANRQLIRRTAILRAVNRLSCEERHGKNRDELIIRCAEILFIHSDYPAVIVGKYSKDESEISDASLIYIEPGEGSIRGPHQNPITLPSTLAEQAETALKKGSSVLSRPTVNDLPAVHSSNSKRIRYIST